MDFYHRSHSADMDSDLRDYGLAIPSINSHNAQQRSSSTASALFLQLGSSDQSPFTLSQLRDLQHQILIFKCIKTGMMSSHIGGNFQTGFAGNADPEPGRCRRTDGKKWRCSHEVVANHKYCEHHLHRGRNRSKKAAEAQSASIASKPHFDSNTALTLNSSHPQLQFELAATTSSADNHYYLNGMKKQRMSQINPSKPHHVLSAQEVPETTQPLQHFFDVWLRSRDPWRDVENETIVSNSSSIELSISLPVSSSDFSDAISPCENSSATSALKLSMSQAAGHEDPVGNNDTYMELGVNQERRRQADWVPITWELSPLAEVLHSSTPKADCISKSSALTLMTYVCHSNNNLGDSPTLITAFSPARVCSNSSKSVLTTF